MKFGKRLAAEAERRWLPHYISYKSLKHALYADINARNTSGAAFAASLAKELAKVGTFYGAREAELGAALEAALAAPTPDPAASAELRAELQHLRKFAVLNYIAVVKAVKKRNRRLAEALGGAAAAPPLRAVSILAEQHFFTSLRLASLLTRAEIAAAPAVATTASGTTAPSPSTDDVYERYTCPICLDLLRSPVVLSCAHSCCWGCLVAHCSAVSSGVAAPGGHAASSGPSKAPKTPTAVVDRPAVWDADSEASSSDSDAEEATVATFGCPLCRKDQLMDLDRLQVDRHLSAFVDRLAAQKAARQAEPMEVLRLPQPPAVPIPIRASASSQVDSDDEDAMSVSSGAIQQKPSALAAAAAGALPPAEPVAPPAEPALLPPQRPEHRGRLTVLLDIDGTLVTTFTPARAPRLPPSMATYIVGKGGRLNPGGVFVVERPGLGEFLRRLNAFAEVVIFTAGLEDYAAPICDAFEARYPGTVVHRLYRPATVRSEVYPCVKDMSRLGRDLRRCVLLDDTPLAFFHQPNHGVPILPFKGDSDDRLLLEAVAPLLESLAGEADVAPLLARRFNMTRWFTAQGLTPGQPMPVAKKAAPAPAPRRPALHHAPTAPAALHNAPAAAVVNAPGGGSPPPLLVLDWDKTCVDWDTGERLCDELAPELTSLLSMPDGDPTASYLPVTNTVLAEMQRRGVTPTRMTAALRGMAAEVPTATARMLRGAAARGATSVILSDANSAFIGAVLTAAKLNTFVSATITNPAQFEGGEDAGEAAEAVAAAADTSPSKWFFRRRRSVAPDAETESAQRLVVHPLHCEPHGCPLCPSNCCKGRELDALRSAAGASRRVIYAGDGANDLCPALCLGAGDVVLAREGHALAALLAERRSEVAARVRVWSDHEQLAALVDEETGTYC